LLAIIEPLLDESRFDSSKFPWATVDARIRWLRGNADQHYDEHREQIARWRERRGG
jgi:hypothetical protein